jgi:hypothetical protein
MRPWNMIKTILIEGKLDTVYYNPKDPELNDSLDYIGVQSTIREFDEICIPIVLQSKNVIGHNMPL